MANKVEIEIAINKEVYKIALESKMIIEQFQKLLGVYTTSEALGKIAVLMREESEVEIELSKYKKLVDSIYEIVSVNCSDVGEAHAGIQSSIIELKRETFPANLRYFAKLRTLYDCPALTSGCHEWRIKNNSETCLHCGITRFPLASKTQESGICECGYGARSPICTKCGRPYPPRK